MTTGELAKKALRKRREKPKLVVLGYMDTMLDSAMKQNIEPNWGKLSKQCRKLWWENL